MSRDRRRLLIDELTSIGAVDRGDNPGSPIVFHKGRSSGKGVGAVRKAARRLVDQAAEAKMAAEGLTLEQARVRVRKERPDLARAERGEVDVSRLSSVGEPTLDERVRKAVDAQAERLQAEPGSWFGRSLVACRGAVWRSDDGRRLAKLLRSGLTGGEVVKSRDPEVVEALQVLEVWER